MVEVAQHACKASRIPGQVLIASCPCVGLSKWAKAQLKAGNVEKAHVHSRCLEHSVNVSTESQLQYSTDAVRAEVQQSKA